MISLWKVSWCNDFDTHSRANSKESKLGPSFIISKDPTRYIASCLSHYLKNHIGQFWNDVICEQPLMSGPVFLLPVVKMSWEKNSKKKPVLLVNFCFLIHFDFSNTRILTFSDRSKVMNPKMPLWVCITIMDNYRTNCLQLRNNQFGTIKSIFKNCVKYHCQFGFGFQAFGIPKT